MYPIIFLFIWLLGVFLSWWIDPLFIFPTWFCFIYLWKNDKINLYLKIFYICLGFFVSNIIVAYWLVNSYKGIIYCIVHAFIPSIAVCFSLFIKQKYKDNIGFMSLFLLMFWIEYCHHYSELGCPWALLGNFFASKPQYVQWYAYVGVLGGTLWVWIVSTLCYIVLSRKKNMLAYLFLIIILLILLPIISFKNEEIVNNKYKNVVYIQYNYSKDISDTEKISSIIENLMTSINPKTDYLILPEIFLTDIWFGIFDSNLGYFKLKKICEKYPKLKILVGSVIKKISLDTLNATKSNIGNFFFKEYNTSLYIQKDNLPQIKSKKFLIPIDEFTPKYLRFLISGKTNFHKEYVTNNFFGMKKNRVSNFICYEAINSLLVAEQQSGYSTGFISMLASEVFFQSDYGRLQYLNICRLRCIEANKYMVKSTQTGFACIIDNKGQIKQVFSPHQFGVGVFKVPLQGDDSFYLKYYWLWFYFLTIISFIFVILLMNINLSSTKLKPKTL